MSGLAAVFQIGYLGDSIVSVPALLSLRELLPDCSEYVLVSRLDDGKKVVPAEIFNMAWPPAKQLAFLGERHPSLRARRAVSIAAMLAKLRFLRPKYAVSLLPAERTRSQINRDASFMRLAGIRELAGFEDSTELGPQHSDCPSMYCGEAFLRFRRLWKDRAREKFGQFARTPLLKTSASGREAVRVWLDATRVDRNRRWPERPLIALAPFSNWPSKHWPAASATALLRRIETEFRVETVIVGGKKDHAAAAGMVQEAGAGSNACGQFTTEQSAALLEQCCLTISVDSGPMHLAAALGVPTIGIYSRTNLSVCRWLPVGGEPTALYREVSCAGCRQEQCPVPGWPCMTGISVEDVLEIAARKLGSASRLSSGDLASGTSVLEVGAPHSHTPLACISST